MENVLVRPHTLKILKNHASYALCQDVWIAKTIMSVLNVIRRMDSIKQFRQVSASVWTRNILILILRNVSSVLKKYLGVKDAAIILHAQLATKLRALTQVLSMVHANVFKTTMFQTISAFSVKWSVSIAKSALKLWLGMKMDWSPQPSDVPNVTMIIKFKIHCAYLKSQMLCFGFYLALDCWH